MTQDELDALPVNRSDIEYREVMDEKGYITRYPYMPECFVLFRKDDDYIAIGDRQGRLWSTGWHDGVQYKQSAEHIARALCR